MATKSIIKNIEISDPAEAEKLVKALEEAKKIYGGKPMKENCSNCKRYMLNGGKCTGTRSRHCKKWKG